MGNMYRYDIGAHGTVAMQDGFRKAVAKFSSLDIKAFTLEMKNWVGTIQSHYSL